MDSAFILVTQYNIYIIYKACFNPIHTHTHSHLFVIFSKAANINRYHIDTGQFISFHFLQFHSSVLFGLLSLCVAECFYINHMVCPFCNHYLSEILVLSQRHSAFVLCLYSQFHFNWDVFDAFHRAKWYIYIFVCWILWSLKCTAFLSLALSPPHTYNRQFERIYRRCVCSEAWVQLFRLVIASPTVLILFALLFNLDL